MNVNQRRVLLVGLALWIAASLLPPALVPAAALASATHPFIEFVPWNSDVARHEGIQIGYLVGELFNIALITFVGVILTRSKLSRY